MCFDRNDISDPIDNAESADPMLRNEPTENADNADPADPIDSTDPTEPMLNTEPLLRIDRIDISESIDHREVPMVKVCHLASPRVGTCRQTSSQR